MATETLASRMGRISRTLLRRPVVVDEGEIMGDISRGEQARRLLEDDLMLRVLDEQQSAYMGQWRASADDDIELRERVFATLRCSDDLITRLRSYAAKGAQASERLEKLRAQEKG